MRRIRIGDVEVAYDREGRGAPAILLHAAYLDRKIWFRTFPALAKRFDTIAVDLPGHGESSAPVDGCPDMIPFLIDLVTALGVQRAHWIGSSFGGGLILRLAAARPDLADRLALFAPTGIPKREMDAVRKRIPKPKSAWEAFRDAFEDPDLATPERYREFIRLQKLAMPFFRRYQATHPPEYATTGWLPEMRRIVCPTLLVWGDRDRIIPPPMDLRTQEAIPGSKLVVLPGAKHFPFMDRPEEVNRLLIEFLS